MSILTDIETYQPLEHSDKSVGIDVEILSFATFSNGTYIPNPGFYIQEEKALAKAKEDYLKHLKQKVILVDPKNFKNLFKLWDTCR